MGKQFLLTFLILLVFSSLKGQDLSEKFRFSGDFRFRIEQDWNSRKSDATYRDDRSRLRYRARIGIEYYPNDWASFGIRIRTGYREKQQDPQMTIGDGFDEFGSVPLGFEKLYFRAKYKWLDSWVGKNTFPFEKQNELFWSDNVFPSGVYLGASFALEQNWIEEFRLSGGHFIMTSSNSTFANDSYIQIIQATTRHWNRVVFFPTFYFFNKMPDIPDGNDNYRFNYSIVHLGTKVLAIKSPEITIGIDLYSNLENYAKNDSIPEELKNQKKGFVGSIVYGQLKEKGDFMIGGFYTYLERYSAVDFLAQNDWVRWDYSEQGSPDGRVTNFKGLEIVAAYQINKNMRLKMRYFSVEQLIPYGVALENGNRIRLDLDIAF